MQAKLKQRPFGVVAGNPLWSPVVGGSYTQAET